jgi:MFS family permease
VADTAEDPIGTTSGVSLTKSGPAHVGAWPMWVLGLVVLIDQVDQNLVRGVVPQLKSEFGIDDFGIGILISSFVLVNGIVTVPAGYLADRWNRTRTIGHTVVAWSGITMLTAASQNFGQLIAGRALLGFGQAITEPSANSLISDYYPTEQRGAAFSVQQIMGIIGFGVGIAVGGAIGSQFGWHWAFIVVGPPGFVIAAIAYRLREPRRGHGDRLHLGITDDGPAEEHQRLFEHGVRRFLVDMITGLRDDLRVILSIPDAQVRARRRGRVHVHDHRHRRLAARVPSPVLGPHTGSRRRPPSV